MQMYHSDIRISTSGFCGYLALEAAIYKRQTTLLETLHKSSLRWYAYFTPFGYPDIHIRIFRTSSPRSSYIHIKAIYLKPASCREAASQNERRRRVRVLRVGYIRKALTFVRTFRIYMRQKSVISLFVSSLNSNTV